MDQITEEKIARFQADVSQQVTATRTNNIMGPLRYILKVAVRRKLISDSPAVNVPPLREEDPKIDPLSADELDRVLAALKPHQRALFTSLAWTGARQKRCSRYVGAMSHSSEAKSKSTREECRARKVQQKQNLVIERYECSPS